MKITIKYCVRRNNLYICEWLLLELRFESRPYTVCGLCSILIQVFMKVFRVVYELYGSLFLGINIDIHCKQEVNLSDI
jgi:uncharacterized protein YydD (DUF2326 family)